MKNRLMTCAVGILVATAFVACGDSADANDGNNEQVQDVGTTPKDTGGNGDTDTGGASADVGNTEVPEDAGIKPDADIKNDAGNPTDTGEIVQPTGGLSGFWAQQTVMSSLSKVPIIGQITTATKTIQKVVISGTSPNYTVTSTPCTVEMESSSSSVKTVVPDAFVRGLVTTERTLTTSGNSFDMPRFWEARGIRLDNVETDVLPTNKTDTRIFDQDADGKPGMTIRITGLISGEVYVIQRGFTQLAGTLNNARLDGLMVWADEQVVLGSDNTILESNQPENKVDPKAENSFFRSTKLASDLSCAEIVQQAGTLFTR